MFYFLKHTICASVTLSNSEIGYMHKLRVLVDFIRLLRYGRATHELVCSLSSILVL